jgi:hypothetical protein
VLFFSAIAASSNSISQFLVQTAALLHQLQSERGFSSIYLSNKGNRYREELRTQTDNSDDARRSFQQFLSHFDSNDYSAEFIIRIKQAIAALDSITGLRDQVSIASISTAQSLTDYSDIINTLINAIEPLIDYGNNSQMTSRRSAYLNFIKGKERAGIERGLLAEVFNKDHFSDGQFSHYNRLLTEQETYFSIFHTQTNPQMQQI